jgi:hypothetical protein
MGATTGRPGWPHEAIAQGARDVLMLEIGWAI